MRLRTNDVAAYIIAKVNVLKTALDIKTIIQGDFTSLPAPEEVHSWANIVLVKPSSNEIDRSSTDYLYTVFYYFDVYFLKKYDSDEPINASLVEETEQIVEQLFLIDDYERLSDGSPIIEVLVTRVDYDSDVEGLLRVLDLDITASKISFRLKAEQ